MSPKSSIPSFPSRPADAHKGQVGRIVIVGGRFDAVGMVGAPAMAANAAFRAGAGLVQILTPREAQLPVSILAPCATTRVWPSDEKPSLTALAGDYDADVLAIGPGLCSEVSADDLRTLLPEFAGGLVIDADGLNLLATMGPWRTKRANQVVLTPHSGDNTPEGIEALHEGAVDNVIAYLEGRPQNVVTW